MIGRANLYRAALYLAVASAATILVSITLSQWLLGVSLAALLASGEGCDCRESGYRWRCSWRVR